MRVTTLSSRELHRGLGRARKAALRGPVVITDRGKPAHVLLSFEEYQRLTRQCRRIADALAMPGADDGEFDPPKLSIQVPKGDLS